MRREVQGYNRCELADFENLLRHNRIQVREKDPEVVLKPKDYAGFILDIRERIRK